MSFGLDRLGINPAAVNMGVLDNMKYYSSSTHSNYFCYLIFRIKNAVLSIFGQSDWQIARSEIVKALKGKMPPEIENKINPSEIADAILSCGVDYLDLTENNTKILSDQKMEEIAKRHFEFLINLS